MFISAISKELVKTTGTQVRPSTVWRCLANKDCLQATVKCRGGQDQLCLQCWEIWEILRDCYPSCNIIREVSVVCFFFLLFFHGGNLFWRTRHPGSDGLAPTQPWFQHYWVCLHGATERFERACILKRFVVSPSRCLEQSTCQDSSKTVCLKEILLLFWISLLFVRCSDTDILFLVFWLLPPRGRHTNWHRFFASCPFTVNSKHLSQV